MHKHRGGVVVPGGKSSRETTGEQQKAGQEPAKNFENKSPQVASKPSTPPDKGKSAEGGVIDSSTGGGHQAAGGVGGRRRADRSHPPYFFRTRHTISRCNTSVASSQAKRHLLLREFKLLLIFICFHERKPTS
jgi:hypothetical protein